LILTSLMPVGLTSLQRLVTKTLEAFMISKTTSTEQEEQLTSPSTLEFSAAEDEVGEAGFRSQARARLMEATKHKV